jgi:hypothetical protein
MRKITFEEAKALAESKGLKPTRLKGAEVISFVRDYGTRYAPISWDEVKRIVEESGGEFYDNNGWIRIV